MELRCDGSEAATQLPLTKKESLLREEPRALCHQVSGEATISKVSMLLCFDGLLLPTLLCANSEA